MPVNLSITNAPEKLVQKLKRRAERNHRSLQGELMAITTEAAERQPPLTLSKFMSLGRQHGLRTPAEAAAIIRADRDSR
jgi:plasmid stability protein